MPFCWNCGDALQGSERYCTNCGIRLQRTQPSSRTSTASQTHHRKSDLGLVLGFVLALCATPIAFTVVAWVFADIKQRPCSTTECISVVTTTPNYAIGAMVALPIFLISVIILARAFLKGRKPLRTSDLLSITSKRPPQTTPTLQYQPTANWLPVFLEKWTTHTTYRSYPKRTSKSPETRERLRNELEEEGYRIDFENESRLSASKGSSPWQILDALSFDALSSVLSDSRTRASLLPLIFHRLLIKLGETRATFHFTYPDLLESTGRFVLERMVDSLTLSWAVPLGGQQILKESESILTRLRTIHRYLEESAKFVVLSWLLFGIPVLIELRRGRLAGKPEWERRSCLVFKLPRL